MPKVTVLMPVYNGEGFLRQAVDSILAQSYTDFELLIVDDGSTDTSADIVRSYPDPRIRLLSNDQNMGLTPSLNRGLREARGEFVARQDADDISYPNRLAEQVAFMDAHPDIALVGSWYRKIDTTGAVLGERTLPSDATAVRWAMRFYCPIVHTAAMWRREQVTTAMGLYDERFASAQDYDYWLRISERFPVANVTRPLVDYRIQPGSLTATYAGVLREFHTISIGAMMRALGWAGTITENEPRFTAMSSLLYGPWREWSAGELARGVNDVWALHDWFYRRFDLTREQRASLTRDISGRLRRTLMRHAARFLIRGPRHDAFACCVSALALRGYSGTLRDEPSRPASQ